ncbi:MAG: insulinase family protein [Bacteroidetes bacterium]|nr:insulinase family protein [Bacteroidota bacterium]
MKLQKALLVYSLFGFLTYSASAQATLVEKVEAVPGKLDIPYERYTLPNGLTLLVSEDHSDPVTHLNVTYHVGSAREIPGKSGFAHFFEHMLFQGSKHVADEEHFELIRRYGGDVNGNTTRDRTVYIETFPSNFTETALWMEADRMGVFLEAFTKKKFEIQRSTVKNEKDQRYNVPYGFLQEVKDQNLYPSDHPYSWSTIGYVDDLDRADSNDLKNFFLRWYGPNNACVIVSGDVNTADVVKWVEKYFGTIQQCPEVRKQRVPPVKLKENGIRSYVDPNAYVPLIYTTFPGAPIVHEDAAAMDVLAYLLGGTRNSVIYKKFIKDEWALQASANNNPFGDINSELAGEFSFYMVGYPWSDIKQLQNMLTSVIDSFEYNNFADEDLSRAIENIVSNYYSGLEDVSNKANYLSTFWYLNNLKKADGSRYNLEDEANRYRNLKREDIMRVYRKYLKGKFSSTVVIEPPAEGTSQEDRKKLKYVSFNPNASYNNAVANAEYANLKLRPTVDNFDRSIKPQPKEAKPVQVPKIYRKTLENGLEILGTEFNETPMVTIQMNIEGGRLFEGTKEIPFATAQFMASAMNDGTAVRTPEELENALEKLGASVSIGAGSTSTSVSLYCKKDKLDEALAIMEEMMFKPRWDEKEYKKSKKRARENAKSGLTSRSQGASNAWRSLIWGDNVFGKYVGADEYDAVELSHCKLYYDRYFTPEVTKLVIVGPVNADEAFSKLAFLNKWQKKNITVPKPTEGNKFETNQIFGVEYIDAEQSDIYLGFRSLPFDYSGEFFQNTIMNFALGGNFNSRLNLNIREDKAWTYGIRSGYQAAYKDLPGSYVVSAGVKAGATDSAIREIMKELERYRNGGITKDEFDFTKQALVASEAMEYESLFQKSQFLLTMAIRNLPEDYPQQQMTVLKGISQEDINKLAKQNLKTDEVIILVAGDMLLLKERLEDLGYGKIQMLDKTGKGKIKIIKATKSTHDKNYK